MLLVLAQLFDSYFSSGWLLGLCDGLRVVLIVAD